MEVWPVYLKMSTGFRIQFSIDYNPLSLPAIPDRNENPSIIIHHQCVRMNKCKKKNFSHMEVWPVYLKVFTRFRIEFCIYWNSLSPPAMLDKTENLSIIIHHYCDRMNKRKKRFLLVWKYGRLISRCLLDSEFNSLSIGIHFVSRPYLTRKVISVQSCTTTVST